jgi:hypothetical protein
MPDPRILRDSTQIVLRCEDLEPHREDLEREFTVTVVEDDEDGGCRVVGSPVEIKRVGEWLNRRGHALR